MELFDSVGALNFADELDDGLDFHASDLGLGRHVAKAPVVLPGAGGGGA